MWGGGGDRVVFGGEGVESAVPPGREYVWFVFGSWCPQGRGAISQSGCPASLQIAIHRKGSCAPDAERKEPRDVQQVRLIAGRAEVCARRVVGHELDRAESVGKMDGED